MNSPVILITVVRIAYLKSAEKVNFIFPLLNIKEVRVIVLKLVFIATSLNYLLTFFQQPTEFELYVFVATIFGFESFASKNDLEFMLGRSSIQECFISLRGFLQYSSNKCDFFLSKPKPTNSFARMHKRNSAIFLIRILPLYNRKQK